MNQIYQVKAKNIEEEEYIGVWVECVKQVIRHVGRFRYTVNSIQFDSLAGQMYYVRSKTDNVKSHNIAQQNSTVDVKACIGYIQVQKISLTYDLITCKKQIWSENSRELRVLLPAIASLL